MSHKSVRLLIENTVKSLQDNIQYSYGEETDFNQDKKKHAVMVNTAPLIANAVYSVNGVSNYSKSWQVQMVFVKFDTENNIHYSKILDETDALVDRFLNKLNYFMETSDGILLSAINQQAVIKVLADTLTGHTLTFTLQTSDTFNYCEDCG